MTAAILMLQTNHRIHNSRSPKLLQKSLTGVIGILSEESLLIISMVHEIFVAAVLIFVKTKTKSYMPGYSHF